jgi:hypothetical protein
MKVLYMLLLVAIFSCNSLKSNAPDICIKVDNAQMEQVSLENVKRIMELNGSFVKVKGVLHYNFEDVALYPTMYADPKHAIWLNLIIPETIPDIELKKLNGIAVTVIGKVNTSRKGHFNMYIATLDSAICIKKTK